MSISLDDIYDAAAYVQRSNTARRSGGGPPKKTTCKNGHDLAEHGFQQYKTNEHGVQVKNGRGCAECKRISQRKGEARPAAQKPRAPGRNPNAPDYEGPKRFRKR